MAFVLVQTELGVAGQVADAAGQVTGVVLSHQVTGPYDVIVQLDGASPALTTTLAQLRAIPGVSRTVTCLPSG